MKECNKIQALLIDYADKAMDAGLTEEVQVHLKKCKSCQKELDEILEMLQAIETDTDEKAPESLRADFQAMLNKEKKKIQKSSDDQLYIKKSFQKKNSYFLIGRIAAGVAILITGIAIGMILNLRNGDEEINTMKHEISEMRQMMMLEQLQKESPSQRIQAVSFIEEEVKVADPKFIDALKKTIQDDPSANVRIAAATALSKYSNEQSVRDFLIGTLVNEEDPLMQITLINLLVRIQEKRAVKQFERMLKDDNVMDEVKSQAKVAMDVLV